MQTIRIVLPYHLRNLARVPGEVQVKLASEATLQSVLDELEKQHPMLRGTIRDHTTLQRRPFIRFFACKEDLSYDPIDQILPAPVINGSEPLLVVGAMAGG